MQKAFVAIIVGILIALNMLLIGMAAANPVEKIPVVVGFKGRANADLVTASGGDVKYQYETIHAIACALPQQAIDALMNNPNVAYIDNDFQLSAIDLELDASWGVKHIGAITVQDSGITGASINVAVIDTGINYNHIDLKDRYSGGWNFVAGNNNPFDDNGHGSHCAGIIAATDNNNAVVGVAPKANLYAVKVLDSGGSGSLSNVVAGIDWATKTRSDSDSTNDIQVISMSLGASTGASSLQSACDAAYASGIVVVAASGNDYRSTVSYPAAYSSVIAVGATDSSDKRASFSNYGSKLELVAPGVNIISDYIDVTPNDGLNQDTMTMSGTSMACPHVAGVAALILSIPVDSQFDVNHNGVWDASEVRNKLDMTAKDLGTAGRDIYYGYGLVDAVKATSASAPDTTPPTITELTPANGATVYTASPTISAKVSDPSGINENSISMTLDGNSVTPSYSSGIVTYAASALADGSHQVSLSVSDGIGNYATQPWSFIVSSQLKPMHVGSIGMKPITSGLNTYATATIKIVDSNNVGVSGATLTGQWSGATSDLDTAITGADGVVTLQSNNVRRAPHGTTFTITVTNVQLAGYTFVKGTDSKSVTT